MVSGLSSFISVVVGDALVPHLHRSALDLRWGPSLSKGLLSHGYSLYTG